LQQPAEQSDAILGPRGLDSSQALATLLLPPLHPADAFVGNAYAGNIPNSLRSPRAVAMGQADKYKESAKKMIGNWFLGEEEAEERRLAEKKKDVKKAKKDDKVYRAFEDLVAEEVKAEKEEKAEKKEEKAPKEKAKKEYDLEPDLEAILKEGSKKAKKGEENSNKLKIAAEKSAAKVMEDFEARVAAFFKDNTPKTAAETKAKEDFEAKVAALLKEEQLFQKREAAKLIPAEEGEPGYKRAVTLRVIGDYLVGKERAKELRKNELYRREIYRRELDRRIQKARDVVGRIMLGEKVAMELRLAELRKPIRRRNRKWGQAGYKRSLAKRALEVIFTSRPAAQHPLKVKIKQAKDEEQARAAWISNKYLVNA